MERITFAGSTGASLSGVLHTPSEGPPRGSVLLAHCFTCSKELHTQTRLADALADGGYRHLLTEGEDEVRENGTATVDIGGRPFPISSAFLDDLETHDQAAAVAALGRPLLVVHAVDDEIVPVSEGEANFAAATQPKAFMPLLDSDHLVTSRASADQLATVLLRWLDATLI